ncbi:cell wall-binding repeat-containing protein [Euzebya tangerina]|uniref:cell wall-binding repeat-containing protein n=1 Tax=Euzebya tangerina TaxID=591198 RepID=UPI000E3210FD|nr:cell wall-binding repeat-containing protein [Euzebya tangerina]
MRRTTIVLLVLSMLLAAAPAIAQPASSWPGADGQHTHDRRSLDVGPTTPGVLWESPLADLDVGPGLTVRGVGGSFTGQGIPIIDDGVGHLITPVVLDDTATTLTIDDHALVALNQSDGSLAWSTDPEEVDVQQGCTPWIDGDGDLWTLAARSAEIGDPLPNVLPVRLNSLDGTVAARPLDDVAEEDLPDTRHGRCELEPTMVGGDVVVFQTQSFEQPLVAVDLAAETLAWTVDLEALGYAAEAQWVLGSDDGSTVLVGVDTPDEADNEVTVLALDAADGSLVDSQVVTGERFNTIVQENTVIGLPDGGIVLTTALPNSGGALQGRLMRLSADLDVVWDVATETDEDAPVTVETFGSLALGGASEELVIGWDASTVATTVSAVSIDDGASVWEVDPAGLESVPSITVDADGRAYVALAADADHDHRLQVISPDGAPGFAVASGALSTEETIAAMGPVVDGTLFAATGTAEDAVFVAFDNSGEPTSPVDPPTSVDPTDPESLLPPGITRPASSSDDPRQVAIDLCQYLNPEEGSARAVVLAQDVIFADALAGSPLAGDDGCVLFTGRAPETLDPRTAAEIDRALPPGGTVYLLGGTAAVAPAVESELLTDGYDVRRLAGQGRVQTAIAIAGEVVREVNPAATTVMLAFEGNWPDAVTGGAYGAEAGIPILLTATDELSLDTRMALASFEFGEVILLGSDVVVSEEVQASIGLPTSRAGGVNRMATATDIAGELWQIRSGITEDRFLLVNLEAANAWTLALAAAPLSARADAPQLGVGNTFYPTETSTFLRNQGFPDLPSIGLIGGVAFIGEDIEAEIGASIEP